MEDFKIIQRIILCLITIYNVNGLDPLVETNVGLIKGLRATDGNYSMFLGIPYAEVNIDNPFGPSTPYPIFNESFEAYDDSVKCPQFDDSINAGTGALNCLILNVYVPDTANSKNLLPVMVYIHGGGFHRGSGGKDQCGAKFLVRHDVILVTFSYRTGVYGFMCLGIPEIPGNQGLKDQLIALRWIKNNIKTFGGNSDNITIFGASAGGRSVDFHLMADDENLFHKAILESGNSLSPPGVGEVNTNLPITLAKALGFETDDFRHAVIFLTTQDPKLLVSIAYDLGVTFQACVENNTAIVDRFVPDYTINRKVQKVKTTPILIGFNNNERYFGHVSNEDNFYKNIDFFGGMLQNYFTFDEKELAELAKVVKTFYTGDEILGEHVKQEIADFDSDFTYIHPTHRRIAHYLSNGAKIYQYMFSYDSERNFYKKRNNVTVSGAVHADELGYLFDMEELNETPIPEDQLMIDKMTTMWTNFAKYGDPTPETSELLPVKWEPITDSNWYYYSIDSEISLKRRPLNHRMTFLDLFFKMNDRFQNGFRVAEN